MKSTVLSVVVLSCVVYAGADQVSMNMEHSSMESSELKMTSTGGQMASAVNMRVQSNSATGYPQIEINVNGPARLTVYDQYNQVALTEALKAGKTTVDTKNFPLGSDRLVVTASENGATFTMKQDVYVAKPVVSSP